MKLQRTLLFSALAAACAASAGLTASAQQSTPASQEIPDAPQATPEAMTVPNGPYVVMDTSMGRITCQFFQRQAPNAVANFIALAEGTKDWADPTTKKTMHHKRYYDGTIFHRVIPQFMIQGGDPTGTGMGDPGYAFNDEFDANLNFDRAGRLAMANSGPNTNGSQFFITEQPFDSGDGHYVIFGQCDDASVDVVKAIARVPRNSDDRPLTPVVLEKVTIFDQPPPPVPPSPPPGQADTQGSHPRRFIAVSAEVEAGLKMYSPAPVRPGDVDASGTVVLNAIIDEQGSVESLHAISGPAILQQATLDAVKNWRYKPYLLNGEHVAVRTQINVVFSHL